MRQGFHAKVRCNREYPLRADLNYWVKGMIFKLWQFQLWKWSTAGRRLRSESTQGNKHSLLTPPLRIVTKRPENHQKLYLFSSHLKRIFGNGRFASTLTALPLSPKCIFVWTTESVLVGVWQILPILLNDEYWSYCRDLFGSLKWRQTSYI